MLFSNFFQNLPVERIWVEMNGRVNYPIKHALVHFDNSQIFDMEHEVHRYCVSQVACKVAGFGLQQVINSWNEHPIAGISFGFAITSFFLYKDI